MLINKTRNIFHYMKIDKIKNVFGNFKEKLLSPFKQDFYYFLLQWIVFSCPVCIFNVLLGNYIYALYVMLCCYLMTYMLAFFLGLSRKIGIFFRGLIYAFSSIYMIVVLYCFFVYGGSFYNDLGQIIAGTNQHEIKEYLQTFISWKEILWFVGVGTGCTFAYIGAISTKMKNHHIWKASFVVLLFAIGALCHNPMVLHDVWTSYTFVWRFQSEQVVDLREHMTHPQVSKSGSSCPETIVIIIGESFSASHSSLYGYKKLTNPCLEQKQKHGSLIVFNQVQSPCCYTTEVFKYILNTKLVDVEEKEPWYDYPNIIEVAHNMSYYCSWFSCQEETGLFDNLPSSFSKLCDESHFLERDAVGNKYDGGLSNLHPKKNHRMNMIFYHLMGQHESFRSRYPNEFEQFRKEDYENFPEHQRDILASYDNATLYNDYVVNAIMDLYQNKDAVVFYFSDHALDIFDTDSNYFGHAKMNEKSQTVGKQIPFIIYITPIFQENHAVMVERMKSAVNSPFNTDKLIYAVMDIANYRFANNDDVSKYSPFRN